MEISIVVVAYNEEKLLGNLLKNITSQDYPHEQIEIILINSMSSDNTREIMEQFRDSGHNFREVRVFDNPGKILACGWNIAIDHFKGDVIIRIDAHAEIPSDFIRKNVETLKTGEYVVGGRRLNIIDEATPFKEILLLAEQSVFGSSVAPYRNSQKKSYVISLFHGAYRREVIEKVGYFNEQLGRTEDNEFNYRVRKAGYQICYSPDIVSYQHTRNSLPKILKQKFGNGYWVSLTLKACPGCLAWYHFVPLAFVLGILFTTILAFLQMPFFSLFIWSLYGTLSGVMTALSVKGKKKYWQMLLLPGLFLLLHISYGGGSLLGLLKLPFWKVKKQKRKP